MIDIKLTSKAISEPVRHNAYYKLVIMLAISNYCATGKKASIQLIHLVFWGLRTDKNYKIIYDFAKKERQTITPWSFETGIDKVLSLGYINGYFEKSIIMSGKHPGSLEIRITTSGEEVLKKINDLELFKQDLVKIQKLGKIPKSRIINANKKWTLI